MIKLKIPLLTFLCIPNFRKFTKNAGHKKVQPAKPIEKVQVQVSTEEPPADEEGLFGALDSSSHSSDKGHRFLKYNSKAKTISIQVTGLTTQVWFQLLIF